MRELGIDIKSEEIIKRTRRIALKEEYILSSELDLELVGLIEKSRFGCLPLRLAARYGISRLIDSRNCYELIQSGFVISRSAISKNAFVPLTK